MSGPGVLMVKTNGISIVGDLIARAPRRPSQSDRGMQVPRLSRFAFGELLGVCALRMIGGNQDP
jgi:hypothetical protein